MTRAEAISRAKALADETQRPYQVLERRYRYSQWKIEFAGRAYSRAWFCIGIYHPKAPKNTSQQMSLALAATFHPSQEIH